MSDATELPDDEAGRLAAEAVAAAREGLRRAREGVALAERAAARLGVACAVLRSIAATPDWVSGATLRSYAADALAAPDALAEEPPAADPAAPPGDAVTPDDPTYCPHDLVRGDPACRLCRDADLRAERDRLAQIVAHLAASDPAVFDLRADRAWCPLCGAAGRYGPPVTHYPSCPWLRATREVAGG